MLVITNLMEGKNKLFFPDRLWSSAKLSERPFQALLAKLRKATTSVHPSVGIEKLYPRWTDFLNDFLKVFIKIFLERLRLVEVGRK